MEKKKRGLVSLQKELIVLRRNFRSAHQSRDFDKINQAMEKYATRIEVHERYHSGRQTSRLVMASAYALFKGAVKQAKMCPENPMNLFALQQTGMELSSQGVLLVKASDQAKMALLLARSLRSFLSTPYAPMVEDGERVIGWTSLREIYAVVVQKVLSGRSPKVGEKLVQSLTCLAGQGVPEGWDAQSLWFEALAAPFQGLSRPTKEEAWLVQKLNHRPPVLKVLTKKGGGLVLAFPCRKG